MKQATHLILSLIVIILISITCTEDPAGPDISDDLKPKGKISGFVYDKKAQPIKYTYVNLNSDSATSCVTDSTGFFTVGRIIAGDYFLKFMHRDYDDTAIVVTVATGENIELQDTVAMSYGYYILSGRIVDSSGTLPVLGAGVCLAGYPISTITDENGKFILNEIRKDVNVKLICAKSGVGFASLVVLNPVADDTTRLPDIPLTKEGATVSGIIYNKDSTVACSVVVSAVGGGLKDTTDENGQYRLVNFPSNETILIEVTGKDGTVGSIMGIDLEEGAEVNGVDIHLHTGSDTLTGFGMKMTVSDMVVKDTVNEAPVRLYVYPKTDITTFIDSFYWRLEGTSNFLQFGTTVPELDVTVGQLKTLDNRGGVDVTVSVVAKNINGDFSETQSFMVMINTASPEISAGGSIEENGNQFDTLQIYINNKVWLTGTAFDPFGGIDSIRWDFGDGSPVVPDIMCVRHTFMQLGTFHSVFRVVDFEGNTASDTVIVITKEPSLGRPQNISPANGDTLYNMSSVTLLWHPVSGTGVSYDVYLDSLNFPAEILKVADITDTTVLFEIDSGITYSWKVVAKKDTQTGIGDSWKITAGGTIVTIAPTITGEPQPQTVNPGQTATFGVIASGTKPFAYQWQIDSSGGVWDSISGATDSSYMIPATVLGDSGSTFRCIVSNKAGTDTSAAALLTVTTLIVKPDITGDPQPQTVFVGDAATFGVVATGTKPFTYQWQKDGTDITGCTDSSYTIASATIGDSGTYRCMVSNGVGSDTSAAALLTVIDEIVDTVTDIDGNVYHTVKIGNQVWTVENLQTTKYNDGTAIPHVTDSAAWDTLDTPGYCYFNNTSDTDSINKFGALFNWYAVNTGKLAPEGWHVPTDADWDIFQNYLIANGYNWDGTTTGNKIAKSIAAKTDWISSDTTGAPGNDMASNNSSGFSALPGGYRYDKGSFFNIGLVNGWWSATGSDASNAWGRDLGWCFPFFGKSTYTKMWGFSVRLVRD